MRSEKEVREYWWDLREGVERRTRELSDASLTKLERRHMEDVMRNMEGIMSTLTWVLKEES